LHPQAPEPEEDARRKVLIQDQDLTTDVESAILPVPERLQARVISRRQAWNVGDDIGEGGWKYKDIDLDAEVVWIAREIYARKRASISSKRNQYHPLLRVKATTFEPFVKGVLKLVYDEGYDAPLINHYAALFVIDKVPSAKLRVEDPDNANPDAAKEEEMEELPVPMRALDASDINKILEMDEQWPFFYQRNSSLALKLSDYIRHDRAKHSEIIMSMISEVDIAESDFQRESDQTRKMIKNNETEKKKKKLTNQQEIQKLKETVYERLEAALKSPIDPYSKKFPKDDYFEDLNEKKLKPINYHRQHADFAAYVCEAKEAELFGADGDGAAGKALKQREATSVLLQDAALTEELSDFLLHKEEVAHNISQIKYLLRRKKKQDAPNMELRGLRLGEDFDLNIKFKQIVSDESSFWTGAGHVREAYCDFLAHEWANFPPIKAHVRREFRKYACYSTRPTAKGQQQIDSAHPAFAEMRVAHRPLWRGSSHDGFVLVDSDRTDRIIGTA
jgi:hypothetical protein